MSQFLLVLAVLLAQAPPVTPEPGARPSVKVLTVIPLKTLDANDLAPKLKKLFPKGVTIAPVRDENAIIVYATEAEMKEIIAALKGEVTEPAKPLPEPKKYAIQFKDVPWADVLKWYSDASGLTAKYTEKPKGNVTIMMPKDKLFTLGEITDLINESLMHQRFMLIRGQVSFTIVSTDKDIDLTLIPRVDLAELPQHGKTEMVQVLIPLNSLVAEDMVPQVKKILTPFGAVSILGVRNTLVVVDTVGNIQRIAKTLADVEADAKKNAKPKNAPAKPTAEPKKFTFKFKESELRKYSVPAGSAEAIAKTLSALDPTLRIIALPTSNEILVLGTPEQHFAIPAKLK